MIDAIYASKLYRTSKRKSAIAAAANNPLNTELVTQIADALSPVYKKEEYLVNQKEEEAKAKAAEEREAEELADENTEDEEPESKPSPKSGHSSSNLHDSFKKAQKSEDASEKESKPSSEGPSEEPPKEVENSTSTSREPVVAATRSLVVDMKQQVDEIKGLLNLQDTTTGVNRILIKDSELWIYYNDNINLNNVMASAIELLNASGYNHLEFNRLARSDNAIVFQILFKDTDVETKPIDSEVVKDEKND